MQHQETRRAEEAPRTPARPVHHASRQLFDTMEQVVAHLATLCSELETLLSKSREVHPE